MSCWLCGSDEPGTVRIGVRGRIDWLRVVPSLGRAALVDWKTSQYVQPREAMQADVQLPIYGLALISAYPGLSAVSAQLYYPARSFSMPWRNDDGTDTLGVNDLRRARKYLQQTAGAILLAEHRRGGFKPAPNAPVLWVSYSSCREFTRCPRAYAFSRRDERTSSRLNGWEENEVDWGNDAMRYGRLYHQWCSLYVAHLIERGVGSDASILDSTIQRAVQMVPMAAEWQDRLRLAAQEFVAGDSALSFGKLTEAADERQFVEWPFEFEIEMGCPLPHGEVQERVALEVAYPARPGETCSNDYGRCPWAHLCKPASQAEIPQISTAEEAVRVLEEIIQREAGTDALRAVLAGWCKEAGDVLAGTEGNQRRAGWRVTHASVVPMKDALPLLRKRGVDDAALARLVNWASNDDAKAAKAAMVAEGVGRESTRSTFVIEKARNK